MSACARLADCVAALFCFALEEGALEDEAPPLQAAIVRVNSAAAVMAIDFVLNMDMGTLRGRGEK